MSQETKPHAHKPKEPIAAFCHTCKVCGVLIEAMPCEECDGSGIEPESWIKTLSCRTCNGTGIEGWVKAE